jgi:hypothetical protein
MKFSKLYSMIFSKYEKPIYIVQIILAILLFILVVFSTGSLLLKFGF